MTRGLIEPGDTVIFFGYAYPPPDNDHLFAPGTVAVVDALDDDALRCFALDAQGRRTSDYGETLFPEEVIRLTYLPSVALRRGRKIRPVTPPRHCA